MYIFLHVLKVKKYTWAATFRSRRKSFYKKYLIERRPCLYISVLLRVVSSLSVNVNFTSREINMEFQNPVQSIRSEIQICCTYSILPQQTSMPNFNFLTIWEVTESVMSEGFLFDKYRCILILYKIQQIFFSKIQ